MPLLIETAYIGILISSNGIISGLEALISDVCDSMCEALDLSRRAPHVGDGCGVVSDNLREIPYPDS